ncbi:autotransporter domain-containing protein [Otariodibacter oris]|uniref:Outer membrane lipase/esterase n=1 Tax=Otariodibacter oris TaxID=1032623 RepID=A0A420XHZ5_9PAST|nr:autotransporter domain-containing protein [Otariodibacter oris]RKR76761.1 outer membrane lipase/esterase [Otariodibacter oris]
MKKSPLALSLLLCSSAFAQDIVVFGDSLSDIGQNNWGHKASYSINGKSNPLYNELLAKLLGSNITASTKGGKNYAYSGGVLLATNSARSSRQPNILLDTQVDNYLAHGVDPNALHIMWMGGNDIAAILQTAISKENQAEQLAYILTSAQQLADENAKQWKKLTTKGINTVVMPTIPNVLYTPEFFSQFGKAVAQGIRDKADIQLQQQNFIVRLFGQFVINAIQSRFETIFKEEQSKLQNSTQTQFSDFDRERQAALHNSVENLYEIYGSQLADYITKEDAIALLDSKYQEVTQNAEQVTALLNTTITKEINHVGGNVVRLDTNGLFKELLSNPAAYGLSNTVGMACPDGTVNLDDFTHSCDTTDNSSDSMMFADSFHPNVLVHNVMADYIFTTLNSPKEMKILTRLANHNAENAMDIARQESNRNHFLRQDPKTVSAISIYEKQKESENLYVGAKIQFNPEWQFSAIFGHQQQDGSYKLTNAKSKTKLVNTTLRYDAKQWWLGSSVQISIADYDSQRTIKLGGVSHTHQGKSSGSSMLASLFGGYAWDWENHTLSSTLDMTYSLDKIDPFAERGMKATSLAFDEQSHRQFKTGLGLEYRYKIANFQPYLSARWVNEWLHKDQTLRVGLNGSKFNVLLDPEDHSWFDLQAGIQWQAQSLPLQIYASLTQEVGRTHSLAKTKANLGIQYQF